MGTEIDGVNGIIKNTTSDGDITIKGNDGGSEISALTFDMSDAGTATFNHDVKLGDDSIAKFGDSGELHIYHHNNGSSYIQETGSGDLNLLATEFRVMNAAGTENKILATTDGSVDLYHNNVKKFETTAAGVDITGAFTATAASTITLAGTGDNLTLASTDAGASAAPNLRLYRNSSSPADDDLTATVDFEWRNDNSQDVIGFQIDNFCRDVSDGAEENIIRFKNMFNGTLTEFMRADSQSDQAVVTFNELSNDIDFRVESNGQTHMIHVDAGSDHVNIAGGGTDGGGVFNVFSADNTTTLSLVGTDSDASAGPILSLERSANSAATGDEIGKILFKAQNAANETIEYCEIRTDINDATDGSEDGRFIIQTIDGGSAGRSRMEILPGETIFNQDSADIDFRVEGNNNNSVLFVDADVDRVCMGSQSPDNARLHVKYDQANNRIAKFEHSNATPEGVDISFSNAAPDNTSANFFECTDTGAARLIIVSDGDVQNHDNSYGSISDERIKQDIRDSASQWDDIKAVKIRNFKKKDDVRQYGENAWEQIGVVAQELEAVSPKLVKENPPSKEDILSSAEFGTLYEDGDDIPQDKKIGDVKEIKEQVKSVKYSILYMKAIKALQEAQTRIETLETKVAALEG